MINKTVSIICWLFVICAACFSQTSFQGLTPGTSTRSDVARVLGQPVRDVSDTLSEYPPPQGLEKVYVQYRKGSQVVERIEVLLLKPIQRSALIRNYNLTPQADASNMDANSRLLEYFGGKALLVLTYKSADVSSGVSRVGYYSQELFNATVNKLGSAPGLAPAWDNHAAGGDKRSDDEAVVHRGENPYDKERLLTVVRLKALPPQDIIEAIQRRGVDFQTTPEVEAEFRAAGATPEMIQALRANYRKSQQR